MGTLAFTDCIVFRFHQKVLLLFRFKLDGLPLLYHPWSGELHAGNRLLSGRNTDHLHVILIYDSCRLGYPGAFPVELQTMLRDGGGLYRGDLHGGGLHYGDLPDGDLVK